MAEENGQACGGRKGVRLGIRGKLIVIFVLIKVIPLVVLALFAVRQIKDLGGTVQRKYLEMVTATRGIVGTVGGGCGEHEIIKHALDVLRTGQPRLANLDMSNDVAEEEGMVCGGRMKVWIGPFLKE